VTNNKGKAGEKAIDNFFAAGYTNENLVDTLLIISERTFSNYLNAIANVPIDFPVAPEI
jgi:alkylhydroperoxidase family enzyme